MAFAFATVASTTSIAEVLYNLKTVMKANGYTVLSSSDGATYNASGDAITSVAEMETANAWFRIRQPTGGVAPHAGVREFTFQVITTTELRIKYSLSAGFIGGVPGILRTPSASDERLVAGAGTDASPTGLNCNLGGGGSPAYIAVETASPFAWYMNHYYASPSSSGILIGFDPVMHAPYDAGDLDDSDLDPYVLYGVNGVLTTLGNGIEQSFCHWYSPDEEFWGLVNCATWGSIDSSFGFPGSRTVGNPYNLRADTLPVPWAGHPPHSSFSAPASINTKVGTGTKGFSRHLRFTELLDSSTIFSGDKLTLTTTRDYMMMGNAAFPWNGT